MTEDEAKTKWCPAFRGNDHGTNRPNEIGGLGFCIGSACMAWREEPPPAEIVGPVHGYCGLAERPANGR